MKNQHLRLFAIALANAVVAYVVFALASELAWWIFPYPENANEFQRNLLAYWHGMGEKAGSLALVALTGFVAARMHRPTWRYAVVTAVATGYLFQAITISVFVIRFGFETYWEYHSFWQNLLYTLAFSCLFGHFAVWREYRADRSDAHHMLGKAIRS